MTDQEIEEILASLGYPEWECEMGTVLISPDGVRMEFDHPDSPLREMGMI